MELVDLKPTESKQPPPSATHQLAIDELESAPKQKLALRKQYTQ